MSERRDLLVSIANEIKTYRKGEIDQPTPEHVDRWASQFTPANQIAFLREFNHVIKQTFLKLRIKKKITRKNMKFRMIKIRLFIMFLIFKLKGKIS